MNTLKVLVIIKINTVVRKGVNEKSILGLVDFIEDREGNFQIIEVNTVPGLTETSLFPKAASYAGLSFDDVVIKVLHLSCK